MIKKIFVLFLAVITIMLSSVSGAVFAEENEPEVYGKAAILMDMDTGRILFGKNIDEKIYPASTTKIMTATLILEMCGDDLGKTVVASDIVDSVIGTGASHIGIRPGEELTVEQLLYAVLVASANEACDVLAQYVCSGSTDAFVELMNQKASELGMENTHFTNTHGFHNDNHYTTARDMATLTRYAMKNEKFREIVKTPSYTIPKTNKYNYGDGTRTLSNTSDLIKPGFAAYYKYATGVKTGYTSEAGNCLVASATKESSNSAVKSNMNFIAATFNSQDEKNVSRKYSDVKNMFEYGFNNFKMISVATPGEDVGETKIFAGKGTDVVSAVSYSEVSALLPSDTDTDKQIEKKYTYFENIKAPIKKGDKIGSAQYIYTNEKTGEKTTLATTDLVAKNDIDKDWFKQFFSFIKKIFTSAFFVVIIIIIIILGIVLSVMRNQRKKRRRKFLKSRKYGR